MPALRTKLKSAKLDGFFIPHEDAYLNEYLPECYERLAWVTGFTGSAGAAIVLQKSATVFVDGRYTLQAEQQIDPRLFSVVGIPEPGPAGWLEKQSLRDAVIGYDPMLVAPRTLDKLKAAAQKAGARMQAVEENPIDLAWTDQPDEPITPLVPHDASFAGETHEDKRNRMAEHLRDIGAYALVVTSPASVAWLFNIRGNDVQCSPLPLARALLYCDGRAEILVSPDKVTDNVMSHLGDDVEVRPISELSRRLRKLDGRIVSIDSGLAPAWFFDTLKDANASLYDEPDPIAMARACKNVVEIAGAKRAHLRDGVALTRFLAWLHSDEVQSGGVTEIDAAQKLEGLRATDNSFLDISFETIAGAGPNGAIVHYRVNEDSNRSLLPGDLFLVDSGGQYRDGTTDVTRTVAIGEPTQEMKERYTLVLKGHIAMANIRFPAGITGSNLDVLARAALWERGLDYDHGTGHGVGSYLGVHEGPQRISKAPNSIALRPRHDRFERTGLLQDG